MREQALLLQRLSICICQLTLKLVAMEHGARWRASSLFRAPQATRGGERGAARQVEGGNFSGLGRGYKLESQSHVRGVNIKKFSSDLDLTKI